MVAEARLSAQYNLIDFETVQEIIQVIHRWGLLTLTNKYSKEPSLSSLIDLIQLDKKNLNGQTKCVFLKDIGQATVGDFSDLSKLKTILK